MITKENKLDHYSLLYRSEYKYDLRYNDVIYDKITDQLYAVIIGDDDNTSICTLDKNTLEFKTDSVPTNTKIVKLFNIMNNLYFISREDNYSSITIGTVNKTSLSITNNTTIAVESWLPYRNLSYSSTRDSIIIGFNNRIYSYNTSRGLNIETELEDELVIVSAIDDEIYYGYRKRMMDYDPNNPKKRLNLNKYCIGKIGNEKPICRLVSYADIDDVRPISINRDDVNVIVTTSDGYIKLFRSIDTNTMPEEQVDYPYSHKLYKEFIPGFAKTNCNPICTCTYINEGLLYIGNDVGDLVVYKHLDDYIMLETIDEELLKDIKPEELLADTSRAISVYSNGGYLDNVGNAAITDIITYDYNVIVNFDGNGLGLYRRDVKPYIDGDILHTSYIQDDDLYIRIKFKVGHDDSKRIMRYDITISDDLYKDNGICRLGYVYDNTIKIPCGNIHNYDLKFDITIRDDIGNIIGPITYPIETLFVNDPIIFNNQITIMYQTAPSPIDGTNVDLEMDYVIIGSKIGYKKSNILDPGSNKYKPEDYDEITRETIENYGISEGDYFCEIDIWDFNNPLRSGTMTAPCTNGMDWKLRVDANGRLVTEPYLGVTYNYMNIPIDDDLPDKFIYAFRFYNSYSFEVMYDSNNHDLYTINEEQLLSRVLYNETEFSVDYPKNNGTGSTEYILLYDLYEESLLDIKKRELAAGKVFKQFYVYEKVKTIETMFRSRETGDINKLFDFHLLDLIVNCTRMIPLGRSLKLKCKNPDNSEWMVYKIAVNDEGNVNTKYIPDPEAAGIDINSVDEDIRLIFRDSGYSSKITLEFSNVVKYILLNDFKGEALLDIRKIDLAVGKILNGFKYFDLSILPDSHINTTELPLASPNFGNLVFVGRNEFDYNYVADVLRRLSNPVAFAISNEDHSPYEVIKSIDKAGTKVSTSQTSQMQMVLSPVERYNADDLLPNNSDCIDRDSDELFTANYHYFNVYVDGKKLPKEQITPIKAEHGEYSVRFPYPYDISRSTYILQAVNFIAEGDHYIDQDGNYIDDRFIPIDYYYEAYIQYDDRLVLNHISKPNINDGVEIQNVLRFYNGWIFLTIEDGEVRCNSLRVDSFEDRRDNRECPRFYEISSDFENETRRIHLIEDKELKYIYTEYDNPIDAYRIQTYKSLALDKFHPVEAVLNSTLNHTTEEIVASRVVTSQEEVQQLYAGEFPITIDVNGKNLSVSDFVVFVRFLHTSYYTRIDRGYFEVTRKKGKPNTLYIKLDNSILANVNSEIVVTTVDVERTITFNTDKSTDTPYYYLPLMRYDKIGNMQSFYVTDVSKFDVIIDGFTLTPNKDYSLVNCCLHAEIPSMIVFEQGIKPGTKVELNFLDDDVYSTLVFPNKTNSDTIEINDLDNLLVSRTFVVYVNGKKLDASQYEIIDRKHLKLLVGNRNNVVIKFLYKNYSNMSKIISLLHGSSKFMKQGEKYEFTRMTKFTDEYYEGVDDGEGYGKAYQILGYADQSFNNEEDVVYDCNKDIPNIIDTPINNGIFYDLDYFNNDLVIDCNEGYDKNNHTLYLPECQMEEIEPAKVERFKFTGQYDIHTTISGQRIVEIEFIDRYNVDFNYDLYLRVGDKTILLPPDYSTTPKIEEPVLEEAREYGKYRVCNDRIYHDITNYNGTQLYYVICYTDENYKINTLDECLVIIG